MVVLEISKKMSGVTWYTTMARNVSIIGIKLKDTNRSLDLHALYPTLTSLRSATRSGYQYDFTFNWKSLLNTWNTITQLYLDISSIWTQSRSKNIHDALTMMSSTKIEWIKYSQFIQYWNKWAIPNKSYLRRFNFGRRCVRCALLFLGCCRSHLGTATTRSSTRRNVRLT